MTLGSRVVEVLFSSFFCDLAEAALVAAVPELLEWLLVYPRLKSRRKRELLELLLAD